MRDVEGLKLIKGQGQQGLVQRFIRGEDGVGARRRGRESDMGI